MTELGRIQLNRRRWGDVCIVRPMDPTEGTRERALVLNSWVRSWIPFSRPLVGAHHAGEIVEGYLRDCDQVLVATPGEGSTVCGWVARLEPGVLAYVYVLHNFRRQGIGERLMREAGIDPRGARWQFLFSTPRLRRLCRVDLRHPERMPWNGAPNAKGKDGSGNGHGNRRGLRTR